MSILRKYEIMILLTEEFNDSELKIWVFNYAKKLRKFNVFDISVISRGKHSFAYPIDKKVKGRSAEYQRYRVHTIPIVTSWSVYVRLAMVW